MLERTGRIVANDTKETVVLDPASLLDTFTGNTWDELGMLIHVPLSSYEEDLIPLAKLDAVMAYFKQANRGTTVRTIDGCSAGKRCRPDIARSAKRCGRVDHPVVRRGIETLASSVDRAREAPTRPGSVSVPRQFG
jgi:hypothetical protein